MLKRCRIHVGPTIVDETAERARAAGFTAFAGTEHLIVNLEQQDDWGLLEDLDRLEKAVGFKLPAPSTVVNASAEYDAFASAMQGLTF